MHFPEGGVPKEGPSAGIAVATALLSALVQAPVLPKVALSGEITLTGQVLPVGGLKEKLLAALREGVETVVLPADGPSAGRGVARRAQDAASTIATSITSSTCSRYAFLARDAEGVTVACE